MSETEAVPECTPQQSAEEETQFLSQSIIVMMALMGINSIALSYLRKARTSYPYITKYIQDATITTLIGIIAGGYLKLTDQRELLSTIGGGYQEFFMIILLPPILFESAINMHKKSFFKNIGAILMYALLGTFIGSCLIAVALFLFGKLGLIHNFPFLESFAFGSLISATDPVTVLAIFKEMNADKNLYSVIFGESILNDAISIALYKTVTEISLANYSGSWFTPISSFIFLFLGSIGLGFLIGLLCSVTLKKYFGNPQPGQESTETTVMILIPWVSYLIGEAVSLSGIVTILFCGIAMTKYAMPNLSKTGRVLTKKLYQALSSTFEHLVFIFIGIGFFSFPHHWAQLGLIAFIITFIFITMARFGQVSTVTWIVNKFRPRNKITHDYTMVITYSGFRGAMAFALAVNASKVFPENNSGSMMLTITLVYATLTIFIFGSSLVPLLEYYGVQENSNEETFNESHTQNNSDGGRTLENLDQKQYCWDKAKDITHIADDILTKYLVRTTKEGEVADVNESESPEKEYEQNGHGKGQLIRRTHRLSNAQETAMQADTPLEDIESAYSGAKLIKSKSKPKQSAHKKMESETDE